MLDLGRVRDFLADDDEETDDDLDALDQVALALGLSRAPETDCQDRMRCLEARDRDGFRCPGCGAFAYVPDSDPATPPRCEGCELPMLPWWESAAQTTHGGHRYLARYRLVDELGRGGMGVVYEAFDPTLRRRVALKVLRDHDTPHTASPHSVERLRREAQVGAQLSHPGIVTVHEVGLAAREDGGPAVPFIAMELCERTTFRGLLEGRGQRERVALLARVARAVGHAHRGGVVHRDLKPENILVRPGGEPVVTDFGLARSTERHQTTLTRDGAVMGTLPYMSPEQVLGYSDRVGPAADVWALGVMLYEQLTGTLPFVGSTADLYTAIPQHEPRPPRSVDVTLPQDLQTVCLKALEKDAGRRYPDADALAADLERWLAGEAITARPIPVGARVWRRIRRNPWAATAVIALILLAGSAIGWQRREADRIAAWQAEQAAERRAADAIADARRVLAEWEQQRYGKPHGLAGQRRRLEAARDRLRRVLEGRPEDHEACAELGWLAYHLGHMEQAREHLRCAVELAPEEGRYHYLYGRLLMADYELARRRRDVVDLSSYPDTWRVLDRQLKARHPAILAAFGAAVRLLTPEASPAWIREYADAYVCWIRGDDDEARRKCEDIAQRHPVGGEEGLLLLAHITGDPDERIRYIDQAIDRARSYGAAYVAGARARVTGSAGLGGGVAILPRRRALLREAVELARTAVMIGSNPLDARLALGDAHLELAQLLALDEREVVAAERHLHAAIEAYDVATQLAPQATQTWLARGVASRELGQLLSSHARSLADAAYADAERWLGTAIALERARRQPDPRPWIERARFFNMRSEHEGDPSLCSQAEADYSRALQIEPRYQGDLQAELADCRARAMGPG